MDVHRLFIAALANKPHSLADDYLLAESVFISVTGFSLIDRVQTGELLRKCCDGFCFSMK